MTDFVFRAAVREHTSVIIALAGASGSGKTFTALHLALGLAQGGKIAVIGSEGRRALHYAPAPGERPDRARTFPFDHLELHEPYTPERWLAAFKAAEQAGYAVIVGDSFSDEYVGAGGLVDMKDAALAAMKIPNDAAAWAKPKAAHKKVTRWMRTTRSHLIICLRAEEKVLIEKRRDDQGHERTVVVPIGWQAVCEKTVPFEMMTSIMLHPASRDEPDAPGKPFPIKIQEQHRSFFPPDRRITSEAGRLLAEWAAGGAAESEDKRETPDSPLYDRLLAAAQQGTEALKAEWQAIGRLPRQAMKDHKLGLQGIAAQADRAIESPRPGELPEEKGGLATAEMSTELPVAHAQSGTPAGDLNTPASSPTASEDVERSDGLRSGDAGEDHFSGNQADPRALPPLLAKLDRELRATCEGGPAVFDRRWQKLGMEVREQLHPWLAEYQALAKAARGGMG